MPFNNTLCLMTFHCHLNARKARKIPMNITGINIICVFHNFTQKT